MAYAGECTDGQYRADILASGETSWASNALTFDTEKTRLRMRATWPGAGRSLANGEPCR